MHHMNVEQERSDLAEELDRHGRKVLARLRLCSPGSDARRPVEGGWSQWELAAHLAAIEWTLPRLIGMAQTAGAGGGKPASATAKSTPLPGGIDAYNKREVERRQGQSLEAMIEEFARNREATVKAVRAAPAEVLLRSVRSAGGLDGTAADVLRRVGIAHADLHLAELPELS